jgi:hypothetical protein
MVDAAAVICGVTYEVSAFGLFEFELVWEDGEQCTEDILRCRNTCCLCGQTTATLEFNL